MRRRGEEGMRIGIGGEVRRRRREVKRWRRGEEESSRGGGRRGLRGGDSLTQ